MFAKMSDSKSQYLVNASSGKVRLDAVMEVLANLIQYEQSSIKEKIIAVNTSKETNDDEDEELPAEAETKSAPMDNNTAMLNDSNRKQVQKESKDSKPVSAWAKPLGSKPAETPKKEEETTVPKEEPPSLEPVAAEVEPLKKPSNENENQSAPVVGTQPSSESVAFIQSLQLETALRSLLGIVPLQVPVPASQNVVVTDDMVSEFKRKYYTYRLGEVPDLTKIRRMSINYVEGLVWTLNYYYHGHLSWKWFYEFHTAPFVSGTCTVAKLT